MYFRTSVQEASREGKLRLLMILATIYPEKFEGEKGQNLMKVTLGLMFLGSLFGFHPPPSKALLLIFLVGKTPF